MNTPKPKRLTFILSGYFAPSYSVTLINDTVQYEFTSHFNSISEIFQPTAKQWVDFYTRVNKINVWNWKEEYPNIGVCDGMQWEFEVEYDDKKIKTIGDNNYPLENGEPSECTEFSKTFKKLIKAIEKLVDGRKFK